MPASERARPAKACGRDSKRLNLFLPSASLGQKSRFSSSGPLYRQFGSGRPGLAPVFLPTLIHSSTEDSFAGGLVRLGMPCSPRVSSSLLI
jgi:hypothetical protein